MKQSDKIMPLLMCPSCNEGMGEVNHNNLQIDVDPKCRGVWLDRIELETLWKLVTQADAEMSMHATTSTITAIKYTDSTTTESGGPCPRYSRSSNDV